jgi:glycosyltransferase 2 family protein
MKKKIGSLILRVGISFIAIALIFWSQRAHLHEALHILRTDVSWTFVLVSFMTYFLALAIISWRLQYVFKVQHIKLSFRETYYLTWVGLFFNLFLPSAVGGDIAKAYYAYKHSNKKVAASTSVIWDRLLGFSALIGVAMISVMFYGKEVADIRIEYLVFIFLAFFGGIMLFFSSRRFARSFKFFQFLIPSQKLRTLLEEIYHSLYSYKGHLPILVFTFFLSVVGQSLFILVHYWMTLAVGVSLNVGIFFILVPLLAIISMAPSIGGLGVREAGLIYLFKSFMPNERALALSLLLDMLIYAVSFAAGILYAFKGGLKAKVIHEMEEINP